MYREHFSKKSYMWNSWSYWKRTYIWTLSKRCWRLEAPTFVLIPTSQIRSSGFQREKVCRLRCGYRLLWGCSETPSSVINDSLWIEHTGLKHLIDALTIASRPCIHHSSLFRRVELGERATSEWSGGGGVQKWTKHSKTVIKAALLLKKDLSAEVKKKKFLCLLS